MLLDDRSADRRGEPGGFGQARLGVAAASSLIGEDDDRLGAACEFVPIALEAGLNPRR